MVNLKALKSIVVDGAHVEEGAQFSVDEDTARTLIRARRAEAVRASDAAELADPAPAEPPATNEEVAAAKPKRKG